MNVPFLYYVYFNRLEIRRQLYHDVWNSVFLGRGYLHCSF